jgi:hypothetical protein
MDAQGLHARSEVTLVETAVREAWGGLKEGAGPAGRDEW